MANVNKFEILWENGVATCKVTVGKGVVTVTDTRARANTHTEVAEKVKDLISKVVEILDSKPITEAHNSRYEVRDVVCDYGVFERGELKLITNSRATALLIKEILDVDACHRVYQEG